MAELLILEAGESLQLTHFTAYQGSTWTSAPEVALLLFRSVFCMVNVRGDFIGLYHISVDAEY